MTACQSQATPTPSPTPTLPSTPTLPPTPEATPYPWIPVLEGQSLLNAQEGKCLRRLPIPSLYPATNGGLRDFVPEGFSLGAAVGGAALMGVSDYNRAVAREFNVVVPGVALKFEVVHPEPGRYNFCEMDRILEFAAANQMGVRGHLLVWEQQIPAWVWELSLTPEQWRLLLQEHITQLVTHYKDEITEWDVINEPLTEEGTLKETLWYQHVGPDYIELALQWAHEANPDAQLFINEFATENLNPKSDALYALAQDLVARGVPLDGIGFQMHLIQVFAPDPAQVAENFRRFNALGLEVAITEIDVRILKPATEENLIGEAELYRQMLQACLSALNCDTFVQWGVGDRDTWIQHFFPDFESPLILDMDYQPKPAYWALLETFNP